MTDPRPKLSVEKAMSGEIGWSDLACRPPHCDPRILHASGSGCDFCDAATEFQLERERLGISNSNVANRMWPCPVDRLRGASNYHKWGGNRPTTKAQLDAEIKKLRAELKAAGFPDIDEENG